MIRRSRSAELSGGCSVGTRTCRIGTTFAVALLVAVGSACSTMSEQSRDAKARLRTAVEVDEQYVSYTSVPVRWSLSERIVVPVGDTMFLGDRPELAERDEIYAAGHIALSPVVARDVDLPPDDLLQLRHALIECLQRFEVPFAPAVVLRHGWPGMKIQVVVTSLGRAGLPRRSYRGPDETAPRPRGSSPMAEPTCSTALVTVSSISSDLHWQWESTFVDTMTEVSDAQVASGGPSASSVADRITRHVRGLADEVVSELVRRMRRDSQIRRLLPQERTR